jgi:four helix bundle protein
VASGYVAIQSYQDLEVWQRGMQLGEQIYRLTRTFPNEELFGLTSQLRRAAASVPANIAEGWGRQGTAEFRHFLRIAQGSLREAETHLLLAQRVGVCSSEAAAPSLETIQVLSRQMVTLQRRLHERRSSE